MKKPFTKIICAMLASALTIGVAVSAGCSPYLGGTTLDGDTSGAVSSNGGFAVKKGEYVYFINGIEGNAADNTYGTPVKGSVMRISQSDLAAHNYSSAQTVAPVVAYSGNHDGGLYIYGDNIYYTTPSTDRNSDGTVLNDVLDVKYTKLDGSQTVRDPLMQFKATTYDYRIVEEDGKVYVLYVVPEETLYDETTGVKNLHSYNLTDGKDTLLAYNISDYKFDEDKTSPRVFYTMSVHDYSADSDYNYNQVYTVTAKAETAKTYDTSSIIGWDPETDRYINCGDLVFDGLGGKNNEFTPFNYGNDQKNQLNYTYTLKASTQGHLFYTRKTSVADSTEYLFDLEVQSLSTDGKNPVSRNPEATARLADDGSTADGYKYIFKEGALYGVLYAESSGGITINKPSGGKLSSAIAPSQGCYRVVNSGTATLLFIEGDYLYYSVTGGNGYTINRVNYTGGAQSYSKMPGYQSETDYKDVKVLDLDAASDWYMPELIDGQLLFASETDSMSTYNYIMACDLRDSNGNMMNNIDLGKYTESYNNVLGDDGVLGEYSDTDKYPEESYANLSDAVKYLFYTSDRAYVSELAEAVNAQLEEDDDPVYSDQTLAKLDEFMTPTADNDWKDYAKTRNVNGAQVYANRRNYYYSVLGKMSDGDSQKLSADYKSAYLKAYPTADDTGWYGGLPTVAKVFFIIGMCLIGLLVTAGIAFGIFFAVRKSKGEKKPAYAKRRIKVDTTDDKNIDVYDTGEGSGESGGADNGGESGGTEN